MKDIYKLRYGNYVKVESDLWLFNQQFNGLICISIKDGRIKEIYTDPQSSITSRFLYSCIAYYDKKLILIPMFSSKLAIFDMESKQFEYIQLETDRYCFGSCRSICYYQRAEKIYIFPAHMSAIIKFDVNNYNIEYVDIKIDEQIKNDKNLVFRNQYEIIESKIYIPFVAMNGVAVYDLEQDCFSTILKDQVKNCSTISYAHGNFYFGSFDEKKLYIWNRQENTFNEIIVDLDLDTDEVFNASWVQDDKVVLFPYYSDKLVVYDTKSKALSKIDMGEFLREKVINYFVNKNSFTAKFSGDNEIKQLSWNDGYLQVESLFVYDEAYNKHIIAQYLVNGGVFSMAKEKENSLKEFISIISYL